MVSEVVHRLGGLKVNLVHSIMNPISIRPVDVPVSLGHVVLPFLSVAILECPVHAVGELSPELELGSMRVS